MTSVAENKHIAILGAGPSGLFMYKRLIESGRTEVKIDIFESKTQIGAGMPYSREGANLEHVTNVSGNEIPQLVTSLENWVQTLPEETLQTFGIDKSRFNEYKVVPRLLFGQYLSAQFELLQQYALQSGINTTVHLNSSVTDIVDYPEEQKVGVEINGDRIFKFDQAIICTGHDWPITHEGKVPGYFDSPYPPKKLALKVNHPVAIRGASLTAIDAIRTLARTNGTFTKNQEGKTTFVCHDDSQDFRLVLHTRNGMLPAVRFHLDDPLLSKNNLLKTSEIEQNRAENHGFLSLDFVFEKDFKEQFREKDPKLYERLKGVTIEEFVESVMDKREAMEPFQLLQKEYEEAARSIRKEESIYWKEMLAVLSFAMNYPAKYFSAEDTERLQKVLMPLISIVIAFIPQSSCEELLALHAAGTLGMITVGSDNEVEPKPDGGITYRYTDEQNTSQSSEYKLFVDCIGQPHLSFDAFPFQSLRNSGSVTPARLKFQSDERGREALAKKKEEVEQDEAGHYYLKVPGITINDYFQIVDRTQTPNPRIFNMAVPYMGGYNPDYSGLDFSEAASESIAKKIFEG